MCKARVGYQWVECGTECMRSWISLMSVECAVGAGYDLYKCSACLAVYYWYCGPYASESEEECAKSWAMAFGKKIWNICKTEQLEAAVETAACQKQSRENGWLLWNNKLLSRKRRTNMNLKEMNLRWVIRNMNLCWRHESRLRRIINSVEEQDLFRRHESMLGTWISVPNMTLLRTWVSVKDMNVL